MSDKPFLSIIILSHNTKKLTKRCLASVFSSLKGSKITYEVIVVDNNSTDGSVEMIEKSFSQVNLIKNKKNTGFGAANNQAVQKAKGEFILFLNSDTVVLDNAIEKLTTYFQNNKHINFLGGKLLNTDKTPQASCGPFLSLPIVFLMLFAKGEQLGITRYSPSKVRKVDWISGACIMCRKKDFVQLTGFDEGIFLYMEEVELLYRAKQKSMHVWFYPDSRFIHVGSASSKEWKNPIMNLYKGLLYFYKKHKNPLQRLILRIFLTTKALLGIVLGKLFGNKRIYDAYHAALRVKGKEK